MTERTGSLGDAFRGFVADAWPATHIGVREDRCAMMTRSLAAALAFLAAACFATLLVLGPQVGWVVTTGTVAYAVLTVMLVGVYVAGVLGLGTLVRTFPGGGGGDLVVAASTLAVAAAFGPLRRRVQDLVDRRFNRERYDTRRTVQTFAQGLRDEVDLETLRRDLAEVAGATLRPAYANVWLAVPSRSGERP